MDRQTDQRKRTETLHNKSLHLQSVELSFKMPRKFNDKRIVFSTNGAGKIVYHMKNYEFGLLHNTIFKKPTNDSKIQM